MARIFWDTNIFVYLFQDAPEAGERVAAIRARMQERGDELLTTALTVGELLAKPIREGNDGIAQIYREAFSSAAITVLGFGMEAALLYPRMLLRGIKPADAIQLACAAAAKVDLFLTNDVDLTQKTIPEIPFLTTIDRAPL